MLYFARVSAGLEEIAWGEIRQHQATRTEVGHRRIDFRAPGDPAQLLRLRSVDDVYVYVGRLAEIDHTRAALRTLEDQLSALDFAPALRACAAVRALPRRPTYSITASHLGKRNYSRYDVEAAAHQGLARRHDWTFRPNRPAEQAGAAEPLLPDLDVRILIEEDWALVGLRLGHAPLHRRAYKTASQPGSLKAPIAYSLALLAELAPADVVLDPMCGAGTIAIEAAGLAHQGLIIAGDMSADSMQAARQNARAAGLASRLWPPRELAGHMDRHEPGALRLYHGDARALELPPASVDAVVTNLPWDLQVQTPEAVAAFYRSALRPLYQALTPRGRAVLLTTQTTGLEHALEHYPDLALQRTLKISLFGQHPQIYVLARGTAVER